MPEPLLMGAIMNASHINLVAPPEQEARPGGAGIIHDTTSSRSHDLVGGLKIMACNVDAIL